MPSTQHIEGIIDKIQAYLSQAESEGVYLKIVSHKLDDDWLYVVVEPSKAGVRASDHASYMAKVERQLRADGDENVLLVPSMSE